jgi:RNA polymerase sigma factor (TIGR02999 family)
MNDVTLLLEAIRDGDAPAREALLVLVHSELRKLARAKLAHEAPGHTLQPTALVHEAWLRLGSSLHFENRAHFFKAAAEAMRRILVDAARRKKRIRHGGGLERMDIDAVDVALPAVDDELLAVDEALDALATADPAGAEVVKLCFFAGFTQEEAARELGVSLSTVERRWSFARAWLFREIEKHRHG